MLPVTFGIHKTFLVASTLAARLGPKPVYRNAKCRGGAESSAQAKPSADVPWCREGAHAKRPNSSRIRAHAKQNAPMRSFRKPRTAASFVPKACKTQARKKAAKNGAFATLPHGAETAGNGSEYTSRARASQKRCVRNPSTRCRNCSFEAVKKNTGKGP